MAVNYAWRVRVMPNVNYMPQPITTLAKVSRGQCKLPATLRAAKQAAKNDALNRPGSLAAGQAALANVIDLKVGFSE